MDTIATGALPKLLCVDDDATILASVERLLGRDFQVLSARSGEDAMTLLERNPDVAVVLTDHRLPGISGLGLLAKVQNKAPDAIRALISGYINLNELVDTINTSRIHRLILKPWDNEYFRIQMLEALASHSTLREKRRLAELSVTDPVTGLKNHRYFQDRLRIEVERSLRHNRPVSLAMIDLDMFKTINDRFGHPTGDLLLKGVAIRFLDQVRSLDTVARYGGEEFAIIMPDTAMPDAMKVSERIRQSFDRNAFQFPGLPSLRATISIGVAAIPDHASSAQDLVLRADACLYQAKGQGRNQTVGA